MKSFTSENVAKLSKVNNKPSRKRKVENKGYAVIQRRKMNLKLVTLMVTYPMETQRTYFAHNFFSHGQHGEKWAQCWVNKDSFVSSMYSKNVQL